MNVLLTTVTDGRTYTDTWPDVVDVVVVPVDPDNRTQAERNAQNALDAARLQRVEAELRRHLLGVNSLDTKYRVTKIGVEHVRNMLEQALAAPIA